MDIANKTILLVDDDSDLIHSLTQPLIDHTGLDVVSACNGDDAIAMWEKFDPVVMILDMMLPKRSGFLVLDRIVKSRQVYPKVAMITANRGKRHRFYAESLGVDAYLMKPFRTESLLSVVSGFIRELERI